MYIVAFLAWLLTANDRPLRRVFFGWATLTDGDAWRSLLKGFWINVQVFMIAEVIVLVWALVVAVVRLLPGPACAPVRFLATVYVDVFRGVPALLVIYIVGLGLPQADVPVVGDFSDIQYAIIALSLTYGAYVSEVYRAGIESVHWSQTAAARSLGLTYSQTMRHVVVPQAVRRVIPPLLNDFIGLQKDTALISVLGVLDVVNRATVHQQLQGHAHRVLDGRDPVLVGHHPVHPLARRLDPAAAGQDLGGAVDAWPSSSSATCTSASGTNEVLRGIDLDVEQHQVVCLIGASGSGKSTLLRCINELETDRQRARSARRRPGQRTRASISTHCAARSASSSRASTCSRT